jgi:adenosylmethionine-8-amino-7-oxononanoate aminotransferase
MAEKHPLRILLVDDNLVNQKIAKLTRALLLHLTTYKHEVHVTAYSGHALKLAKQAIENGAIALVVENKKILAGIFIEPLVQCAGGMKFSDPKILRAIFAIAKKHQILFVADECAVGFYRTGKKFACDAAEISPDILVLGKALTGGSMTLAATLVKEEIFKKFLGESLDLALMHGPTFMGNPLACAAANASLDLFEQQNYANKVFGIEKFLKKNLAKCKKLDAVSNLRILGAIAVIEIEADFKKILVLRQKFVENGVFLRPFGNCIYLMPALNIKKSELKKLTDAIYKILSQSI